MRVVPAIERDHGGGDRVRLLPHFCVHGTRPGGERARPSHSGGLVMFAQGGAVDSFCGNCVRKEALHNTNGAVRAIAVGAMLHLVRLKNQALDGLFRLLVSD